MPDTRTTDLSQVLQFCDEQKAICDKATPGNWQLCTHLRTGDATCQCGYRGGIWSGDGESIICEMGGSPERDGTKIVPERTRQEQLQDAAFIADARTSLPEALRIIGELADRLESAAGIPDTAQTEDTKRLNILQSRIRETLSRGKDAAIYNGAGHYSQYGEVTLEIKKEGPYKPFDIREFLDGHDFGDFR